MNKKLIAVLVTAGIAACTSGEAVEAPSMATAAVTEGNLRITAEATGTVEPIRTVEVKSKASGEILRLYVDVGDQVEPGALLAEIDPRDVRTDLNQAEADLQVAQARFENSEAQLQRAREMFAAGVITQQEMESTSLDFANASATRIRSQSTKDLAELRMQDVTIRSPLAGTVLVKNVEEGGVIQSASGSVSGGSTLFTMAALSQMQVRTNIDETDVGKIAAGMSATVTVEAFPDQTFRGVVQKIEPQAVVQSNVTMFPVIITLDNRDGLLKPGMNAEVEILIDQANGVMLIPNNTVVAVSDVMAAAMALGIDPETLDMTQFRGTRGGGAAGAAGRPGGAQGGGQAAAGAQGGQAAAGAQGGGQAAAGTQGGAARAGGAAGGAARAGGAGAAASPGVDQAQMDSLRARVARGEISQDSLRALMAATRGTAAGAGAGAGAQSAVESRPAFVFVMVNGAPQPKMIQIGLNDWDRTQVVSGLEGNEELAVIGAAQLMASQAEALDRMRSRGGGMPFGR